MPKGPTRWQGKAVTPPRDLRNLALVGFMGSGKSTVGRMVARQLGMTFADTDDVVEGTARRRISEIFATEGEAVFRQWERRALEELVAGSGQVIATGGGLVCQPGNMELLKGGALVVCLWASVDTIWERVRHQTHRPLLQVADPKAEIARLLTVREPYYRAADVLVNSGLRSLREVAVQVAHHYQVARQQSFRL